MNRRRVTIDTSRTLEIAGSRAKLALLAIMGAGMTGLSAAIAFRWLPDIPGGSFAEFVGWVGLVFFGLCLAIILRRLVGPQGPVVTITPEGIRDTRVAAEPIPWRAVRGITTWEFQRQKVMVLAVDPAVEDKLALTTIARWSRAPNRKLGADGLCITAQGIAIDYDTLFATSVAYAEAAQRRRP